MDTEKGSTTFSNALPQKKSNSSRVFAAVIATGCEPLIYLLAYAMYCVDNGRGESGPRGYVGKHRIGHSHSKRVDAEPSMQAA